MLSLCDNTLVIGEISEVIYVYIFLIPSFSTFWETWSPSRRVNMLEAGNA